MNRLDRFFEISARGSTVTNELRGGVVTFIAMAYIIVLNPIILSGIEDVTGDKLGFDQVSAVTSLAAGVMTILFGVISRLPFAFAAGLGLNIVRRHDFGRLADLARGDGAGRHQRAHHRHRWRRPACAGWSSTPCRCS